MERALAGDQDAYRELYRDALTPARRAAGKILRAWPNDIDDAAHTGLARALMNLGQFRGDCAFSSWVHKTVGFEALCRLRELTVRRRRLEPLERENEDGEVTAVDVPWDDPEYAGFEARKDLARVLGRVPSTHREVLEWRFLRGESNKATAEHFGVSINAMKSRTLRALASAQEVSVELNERPAELPLSKRQCEPCKKSDRFRFADVLEGDVPMCKWCAAGIPFQKVAPVVAAHSRTLICRCGCGSEFQAAHFAQRYIPGHQPTQSKLRPTTALAVTAAPVTTVGQAVRRTENHVAEESVAIRVTARALDQMWSGLALKDKARAFEILLRED